MKRLVDDELVAKSTFSEVDQKVTSHLRQTQQWNTRQKGNKKAMGARMG